MIWAIIMHLLDTFKENKKIFIIYIISLFNLIFIVFSLLQQNKNMFVVGIIIQIIAISLYYVIPKTQLPIHTKK